LLWTGFADGEKQIHVTVIVVPLLKFFVLDTRAGPQILMNRLGRDMRVAIIDGKAAMRNEVDHSEYIDVAKALEPRNQTKDVPRIALTNLLLVKNGRLWEKSRVPY
jgi:hypothetical protein